MNESNLDISNSQNGKTNSYIHRKQNKYNNIILTWKSINIIAPAEVKHV